MLFKICMFFCFVQIIFASADDDRKNRYDQAIPEVSPDHMIEVAAAFQMRALVLDVVKEVRESLKEPLYLCDDEIEGFQGYDANEDDDFCIDKGLLFCVSENNTPGTIYTRWGIWRFAQYYASIKYDLSKFGLWHAICDKIINHQNVVLKPCGRPTSLGGERVYIIKKIGETSLEDPFKTLAIPTQRASRLQNLTSGISKCAALPTSAVRSVLSKGLKRTGIVKKKAPQSAIKRYHPPNRYDSLPYTALLRDSEIYWLQLCLAYKRMSK